MGVNRYEDLRVWQAAERFCREIVSVLHVLAVHHDYPLRNQLNAATLSIVANIAEGFVRRRDKEFAYFVRVARGSNGEARALLQVARSRGYLADSEIAGLLTLSDSIGRMLWALERALLASAAEGTKDSGPRT